MPTPKWKLVVDVGAPPPKEENSSKLAADNRTEEVLKLIVEHTPTHRNAPHSPYLPGFEALRQVLTKQHKSEEEEELITTTLDSYSSYLSSGRKTAEIAWMVARDFMLLSQTAGAAPQQQQRGLSMPNGPLSLDHVAQLAGQPQRSVLQSQASQLPVGAFPMGGIMSRLQQSQMHNAFGLQPSALYPMVNQHRPPSTHQHHNPNL
jgi:hypothetical protein